MKLSFTKMQGAGNDYVYVDCMKEDLRLSSATIAFLSDRRFGVGGDGVIFIRPSARADGCMDMYNLDGSQGKMCGNGIRCVGKYLFDHGYAQDPDAVRVDTRSGVKTLRMQLGPDGRAAGATVEMGKAVPDCRKIPVRHEGSCVDIPSLSSSRTTAPTSNAPACRWATPNAVIFTEHIDDLDLDEIGPYYENHRLFPDRVNTEFVEVAGDSELRMRVYERGSGETLACGTGACAAAVAAVLKGLCSYDVPIRVHLRGGDLAVVYRADGTVSLTGPAAEVFTGVIDLGDRT